MNIVDVNVTDLIPYVRNPRKNDTQVDRMCGLISEFGFRIPILCKSDNTVIDGHLRLKAALKLGMATVPVICVDDLSESQIKAFRLVANKSVSWAEWDNELLALEFIELRDSGYDLSMTGFSDLEIDSALNMGTAVGLTDPDDVPDVPQNVVTVPGDLWVLGKHRLLCGDSTSADDVAKVLGGVTPLLMVTDPPYGVNYDPKWRKDAGIGSKGTAIGVVENDDQCDWRNAWALFGGSVAYVWHGGRHTREVYDSLLECGLCPRAQIIWVKTRPVLSRGDYHWQHEPAFYCHRDGTDDNWRFIPDHETAAYSVKKGKTSNWQGSRKESTVWFIEHMKSETGHSTQKPVECMKRPILNNSSPGQAVYDPFLGSGTTVIAAEMTGRCCYGIEIMPVYCDVIVKRWEDFTGEKAVLWQDQGRK